MSNRPECPRCAYDLSGIAASWAGSCPLEGRCSECGLTFAWPDVLSPERRLQRWSFEHATRGRLVRTFGATYFRAFRPRKLWSELRMESAVNPRRLLIFAIWGLLCTKLLGVLFFGLPTIATRYANQGRGWGAYFDPAASALAALWPYSEFGGWWSNEFYVSPWALITLLTALAVPLAFFLLPVSLRRARVSKRHLVRIQAYHLAVFPWIVGMWGCIHALYIVFEEFWWQLLWGLDIGEGFEVGAGLVSIVWTCCLLLWSWTAAVGRYLRMPHALAVAGAMVAIAGLASTLLVVLLYGYALFY